MQSYFEMLIFAGAKAVKMQAPLAKKRGISRTGRQKREMQGTKYSNAACEFK
jgi:hypothetical protein